MKDLHLSKDEWEKLSELYRQAQNTPLILIGGRDLSQTAWDAVRNYMRELGRKYRVNPRQIRFKPPKNQASQ